MSETKSSKVTDKKRSISLLVEHINAQIDAGNWVPSIAIITESIVSVSVDDNAPPITRRLFAKIMEKEAARYWREATHLVSVERELACHPVTSQYYISRKKDDLFQDMDEDAARACVAGVAIGRSKQTVGTRFLEPADEPADDLMFAIFLRGCARASEGQRKKVLRIIELGQQTNRLTKPTEQKLLQELDEKTSPSEND